jgi:hypothetical protein
VTINGLTLTGGATADANGNAAVVLSPSPLPGHSWLVSFLQVYGIPQRSSMVVQLTGFAQPTGGAVVSFSGIYNPGGAQLQLLVSGMQPGDLVVASGTGIDGEFTEMLDYAAAAVPTISQGIATTASIASSPNASQTTRLNLSGTTSETPFVTAPSGVADLFVYYLMIVPTSTSSHSNAEIKDVSGDIILACASALVVPVCLPLFGVNFGGPQTGASSTYLFAENGSAMDSYIYYAVYTLQ